MIEAHGPTERYDTDDATGVTGRASAPVSRSTGTAIGATPAGAQPVPTGRPALSPDATERARPSEPRTAYGVSLLGSGVSDPRTHRDTRVPATPSARRTAAGSRLPEPSPALGEQAPLHHGSRAGFPRPNHCHDGRATGTAAQEGPPPMFTATKKRSTIGERPAEAPTPVVPAPEAAGTSGGHGHPASHLTHCARDDFRAPPAHLLLLRDALADRAVRDQGPDTGGRAGHRRVAPCHRARARSAGTAQLTLSQWVSRTARIGTPADEHATAS
ncbi:hypothetical protein ACFYYY_23810 [Streptomyces sp. NPDC001834]|uniref:hypothetical protein n=1 Tax=unclassified Streptomyces TaxID=2593676 RepID=UPI00341C88A9